MHYSCHSGVLIAPIDAMHTIASVIVA